ncbi:ATP-dependent nuclease [Priestia megaterium]|uniref:ATP-dependent nuclease n=1 Tax=Priestia megaterium TaxID=1404 RepID=UPI0039EBE6B2
MLIKELQLKGWRSYSEEGISLKNLNKINLLIGPNNIGKSNLLKYLLSLRTIFPEGNDSWEEKDMSFFRINEEDRWLYNTQTVEFKVKLEGLPEHSFINRNQDEVKLQVSHNLKGKNSEFSMIEPTHLNEIKATIFWRHFVSNHIRFIGDVRGFFYDTAGNLDVHIDGKKILEYLLKKVDGEEDWIRNYEDKMSKWLKDILLEEQLVFEFIPDTHHPDFSITIIRGVEKEQIKLRPRQLGTGVAHLVLILTTLHACSHRKINIFLEEPEMNLHPHSVNTLTRIFKEDFPNHRFFIFTHSNVWLDQIDKEYSVYNFFKKEDGSTNCLNCTESRDYYPIFENLGIKPSQLLLSNFNIWIEGPSDRIYLNQWIKEYSKGSLIEGKHYSFIMYGGTNLSHYDLVFDNVINILSTGYNAAIICDSDLSKKRDTIKERVQKLKDRIAEKELEDYVMLWITEGREIENYIVKELFEQIFRTEFGKSYFKYKNKRVNLYFVEEGIGEVFEANFSYDDFFVKIYQFDKNEVRTQFKDYIKSEYDFENIISDLEKKRQGVLKDISKVEIAKAIVSKWNVTPNNMIYDLNQRMVQLVNKIEIANR